MATYNTASDSANTAVRAFLTKVGEHYWGKSYNTGSGSGKAIWLEIKAQKFNNCCAYCNEHSDSLQIEHLVMFNRTECGLHHPGNTVPCCKACNKRERKEDKSYAHWEEHLMKVCIKRAEVNKYEERKNKIIKHTREMNHPDLNTKEVHAIKVIAKSLYENIKIESEKSLQLYKELDEAFVK